LDLAEPAFGAVFVFVFFFAAVFAITDSYTSPVFQITISCTCSGGCVTRGRG
jgi:hypothetical protein